MVHTCIDAKAIGLHVTEKQTGPHKTLVIKYHAAKSPQIKILWWRFIRLIIMQ